MLIDSGGTHADTIGSHQRVALRIDSETKRHMISRYIIDKLYLDNGIDSQFYQLKDKFRPFLAKKSDLVL